MSEDQTLSRRRVLQYAGAMAVSPVRLFAAQSADVTGRLNPPPFRCNN